MLSVAQVNKLERVTIGQTVSLSLKVKIGLSARNLTTLFKTSQDIENILSSFDPHENFIFAECRRYLGIYLHFEARPQEVLKAYFYAVSYLQDRNQFRDKYWEVHSKWNEFLTLAQKEGNYLRFFRYCNKCFDNFVSLQVGTHCHTCCLSTNIEWIGKCNFSTWPAIKDGTVVSQSNGFARVHVIPVWYISNVHRHTHISSLLYMYLATGLLVPKNYVNFQLS